MGAELLMLALSVTAGSAAYASSGAGSWKAPLYTPAFTAGQPDTREQRSTWSMDISQLNILDFVHNIFIECSAQTSGFLIRALWARIMVAYTYLQVPMSPMLYSLVVRGFSLVSLSDIMLFHDKKLFYKIKYKRASSNAVDVLRVHICPMEWKYTTVRQCIVKF